MKAGNRLLLPAVVALSLVVAWHAASAGYNYRSIRQKAVGSCQAPLPIYDKQLRKKPGGIVNESDTTVFITCAVPTNVYAPTEVVNVEFNNLSDATVTVSCTLLAGSFMSGVTAYSITFPIPGGVGGTLMTFDASQINGGTPFAYEQGLSCKLPPDVELSSTGAIYNEWSY